MMLRPTICVLLCVVFPVAAQQTINFSGDVTFIDQPDTQHFVQTFVGFGQVGTLGGAIVSFSMTQALAIDNTSGFGQASNGLILAFNRQDGITVNNGGIADVSLSSITVPGRLGSGSGVYAAISNTAPTGTTTTMTITRTSTAPLSYKLSLAGTAVLGGQDVSVAMTDVVLTLVTAFPSVFGTNTGSGTISPWGDVQISAVFLPAGLKVFDHAPFAQFITTLTISQTDSIKFLLELHEDALPPNSPVTFLGGTGLYAGAKGTGGVTITESSDTPSANITGSITLAGPNTPIVTSAKTASYSSNRIAQNAWIEIQGDHMVPATTPAGGMFWGEAPEFQQGKMPTEIGDISVTVNGKPAYIWWFCSAATTSTCSKDQINVLTPLDNAADQRVQIVVKNGAETSAPFLVPKDNLVLSPLLFDLKGHPVATHVDYTLLAPANLYPGYSTPGLPGETAVVWMTGFGLPVTTVVEGSSTQYGLLPESPSCSLEGRSVQTVGYLVSPGLYQLNVPIPSDAPSGDNHLLCTYGGAIMPGVLIAVQ